MHCENPSCVPACPENAIYKREDGIVLIDQAKCKGHGRCRDACPYGVNDPVSPIRAKIWQAEQLLESEKTDPKVFYIIPKNLLKPLEKRIIDNPHMDRLP